MSDLKSPKRWLLDEGSGRGLGRENIRDVLSNAPPGETVRLPIARLGAVASLNAFDLKPMLMDGCKDSKEN